MAIRVEFYGLARQRAGIASLTLDLTAEARTLAGVLAAIAHRLPSLGQELIAGGRLHSALAANLDGQQFISDPATPICDGKSVLILSADAGG